MNFQSKSCQFGIFVSVGLGVFLLAAPVSAKVGGQCALCHTMHNSQGGDPMAFDAAGASQKTPNDVLLVKGCVACHTGQNIGGTSADGVIPYVNQTTPPLYGDTGTESSTNTLAGGNFYWVAAGGLDATGHNVATDSLSGQDEQLKDLPPGSADAVSLGAQLRCAGTNGCHGDIKVNGDFAAIRGTHHGDDTVIDGESVATSFRFLNGVVGLEDPEWEYQPSLSTHNQYKGVDRPDEDDVTGTISSLCASCHNDFHNGSENVGGTNPSTGNFASPWVRHPTDFDMGNTAADSEYRDYGGTGNAYVVSAPVASDNVDNVLQTVNFADDTIVTCISCHRAHGTPYADLLRWDYSKVSAGTGSGACFECHTTKN